jgi:predicted nucleic acid-binding protein
VSFLLDTDVISELRKRGRVDEGVEEWFSGVDDAEVFLSVVTVGEIRRGIESIRRRDRDRAMTLGRWLHGLVTQFESRLLAVDRNVAEEWGRMNAASTLPVIDGLLAATARVHGLTLVTRNIRDVSRTGAQCFNPFAR